MSSPPMVVTIRDTATDERRDYIDDYPWTAWEDEADYIWTDGNCACDCNRSLFFGRAGGSNGFDTETTCGLTAFEIAVRFDGKIVYSEIEDIAEDESVDE